ncbi:MAG TPA: hypothetical protein VGM32_08805 [Rhodopila sp.]
MPDEKWLQNEPQSWHDLNRALQDISTLLAYLGALPEGRLLSFFDDTQSKISTPATRITLPPCPSYPEFLDRLTEISRAFQAGQRPETPVRADGAHSLSPEGFVYWSRDFLAAVAAPATADSIRLTHDYVVRRARSGAWWRRLAGFVPGSKQQTAITPVLVVNPDDETRKLSARRLAIRVRNYEWITMVVVAVTVIVSIYALSGRLILGREKEARDAFTAIDAQVQSQEDKIFPSAKLPIDETPRMNVVSLCSFTQRRAVAESSAGIKLASLPTAAGDVMVQALTDNKPDAEPKYETAYLSALQAHLCPQREEVLRSLFVVTMHLQSWSSVVTQSVEHGWNLGYKSYRLHLAVPLAPIFGVVPSTLSDYAKENDGDLCKKVAPEMMTANLVDHKATSVACEKVLWTLINRARNVAESILGSITQYILPVCYGFLGAMAAAMRLLRRKVDASLLNFTDRSRLQQGAILGLLCGGVIGLFASYIGNADPAGGLGLSAIALLAGYNVDGVFRFLDELSDRIFRPVAPAKT